MASSAERYKMDHDPRGKAIIINNKNFTRLTALPGADSDLRCMERGLKKNKFIVIPRSDQSRSKIMELATDVAKEDHSKADCMVFCINSHGGEGVIAGTDWTNHNDDIKIQDIVHLFTGDRCPTLIGKPKIFIISACAGNRVDKGVLVPPDEIGGGFNYRYQPEPEKKIPETADTLIFNSSYAGYVSYQHPDDGSYFMKSLGDRLFTQGRSDDLRDIFEDVQRDVVAHAQQQGFNAYQIPQYHAALLKKIYFT